MSPKVQPSKFLVYVASSFAIILWGMSYIWTDKLIALGIPVFYFVFVRILLAGAVLFLFNVAYSRIKRIQRQDLGKFLLLAFFEPFIYFICETYGLKETGSPTISAMIIATIPIFSIAAGRLFFKERITGVNVTGVILSLIGIVMVAMAHGDLGENFILGIMLLLTAVIAEDEVSFIDAALPASIERFVFSTETYPCCPALIPILDVLTSAALRFTLEFFRETFLSTE